MIYAIEVLKDCMIQMPLADNGNINEIENYNFA